MDPDSIITIVFTAGKAAFIASTSLVTMIDNIKAVDATMEGLHREVSSFTSTLKTVNDCLEAIAGSHETTRALNGMIPWLTVHGIFENCSHTANAMRQYLESLPGHGPNMSGAALRAFRLNIMDEKIKTLRDQMKAYHSSLQLSLHYMNLCLSCTLVTGPEIINNIARKKDLPVQQIIKDASLQGSNNGRDGGDLSQSYASSLVFDAASDVTTTDKFMEAQTQRSYSSNSHATSLVIDAPSEVAGTDKLTGAQSKRSYSAASHATSLIIDAPSEGAGTNKLMGAQSQGIYSHNGTSSNVKSWLRQQPTIASDTMSETSTTSTTHPSQPTLTNSFDATSYTTETPADGYSGSEDELEVDVLEQCLREANTEFEKSQYEAAKRFYSEAILMAESMSPKIQMRFGLRYIPLNIATCYFFEQNFKEAEEITIRVEAQKPSTRAEMIRKLDATQLLAEIYLCRGRLPEAEEVCRSASKVRYKLLGKEHPSCFVSISLLSLIMELKGDYNRARIYQSMIPETVTDKIVKARRERVIEQTAEKTDLVGAISRNIGKVEDITPEAKANGIHDLRCRLVRPSSDTSAKKTLYKACEQGFINLAHLLLTSWNPKVELCMFGAQKIQVQGIITPEDIDAPLGPNEETALHAAVRNGKFEIVKLMIDAGANSNVKDGNGSTPIHLALRLGRIRTPGIPKLLLEAGADILAKESNVSEYPPSIWDGPITDVKFCYNWLSQHKQLTTWHIEAGKSLLAKNIQKKDLVFIDCMLDIYTTEFPNIKMEGGSCLQVSRRSLDGEYQWLEKHVEKVFKSRGWGRSKWGSTRGWDRSNWGLTKENGEKKESGVEKNEKLKGGKRQDLGLTRESGGEKKESVEKGEELKDGKRGGLIRERGVEKNERLKHRKRGGLDMWRLALGMKDDRDF